MNDRCTCINLSHDHSPGMCEEEATFKGGTCNTCRYADWRHK